MHKPVLHTIFTRGLSTGLNFAIALLIARHSGPAIKGEVTLLLTIVSFYGFFSNILGGQALVYLIPRRKTEWMILPAYLWAIGVAALGYGIIRVLQLCPEKYMLSVSIIGLLSSLSGIHQTLLLARKSIYKSNTLIIIPLLFQVVGVYLSFYHFNVQGTEAFINSALAGCVFTALLGVLLTKPVIIADNSIGFTQSDMKEQLKYGAQFQMVEVLQLLNLRYYFFPLALQQGVQYLGVFSIGISILEAVWIIPRSISTVHYVETSNTSGKPDDYERTIRLIKWNSLLTFVALLILYLVPNDIFIRVFGEGFADVKHSMRFLYPGVFFYGFHFIISAYFQGLGKYKPILVANAIGTLVLAASSLFLIPTYVMSGAGLCATLSFGACALIGFYYFLGSRKLG